MNCYSLLPPSSGQLWKFQKQSQYLGDVFCEISEKKKKKKPKVKEKCF